MATYFEVNGSIVQDFAKRTLSNLESIKQNKELSDVYEVTQLINSLLGLLVFPKEEFWDYIRPVPIANVPHADKIRTLTNESKTIPADLKALVEVLKHSVAHFNITFKRNDRSTYIEDIVIWNEYPKGNIKWKAEATVFDLWDFVVVFASGIADGSYLNLPVDLKLEVK